jgi:hypothetical protein
MFNFKLPVPVCLFPEQTLGLKCMYYCMYVCEGGGGGVGGRQLGGGIWSDFIHFQYFFASFECSDTSSAELV